MKIEIDDALLSHVGRSSFYGCRFGGGLGDAPSEIARSGQETTQSPQAWQADAAGV